MSEPTTKLYFVKKPTMSSADYGRTPVIGKMRVVRGKPRKMKEFAGDVEVIQPTAQEKLTAQIGRQRRRVMERGIFKPVELMPFAEEARQKLRGKTIVGQQQAKIAQEKATAEALQRQAQNTAQRVALLALPQLMRQQVGALQRVAPEIAEQLMLKIKSAPVGADDLRQLFGEEPIDSGFTQAEAGPMPLATPPPEYSERILSRKNAENKELLRRIIEDDGLTADKDIIRRYKELYPERRRLPKNYREMVDSIRGKGLAITTTGKGRKGISGGALSFSDADAYLRQRGVSRNVYSKAMQRVDDGVESMNQFIGIVEQLIDAENRGGGFFSDVFSKAKELGKKAISKVAEKVMEDPIGTAKKAFELGQKGREQYVKLFGKAKEGAKGGKFVIPKAHQKILYKHAKQAHGGAFADEFLSGLNTASKMPIVGDIPLVKQAAKIAPIVAKVAEPLIEGIESLLPTTTTTTVESATAGENRQMTPEEYAKFYNENNGMIPNTNQPMPIKPDEYAKIMKGGSLAFQMGQRGRKQYMEMTGKKEKGGKMFIPKAHQKMLYKHAKQAHGKGFADMFLSGLRAPFDAIAKIPILKDIPIIKQVSGAVPALADLAGVKRVLV